MQAGDQIISGLPPGRGKMIRNYIKTAIRNIRGQGFYSFLNIAGLTIAVACLILVGLYINHETSYDNFHKRAERIYRVGAHYMIRDNDDRFALSPIPIGNALQTEFPEVEMFTRMKVVPNAKLVHDDGREFIEENFLFADSTFFRMFTYEKISGDLENALTEPGSMVLTRSTSRRYFGDESAFGRQMTGGSGTVYTVTGVIEDPPRNSHVPFDGLLSRSTAGSRFGTQTEDINNPRNFWFSDLNTYILLSPGSTIEDLKAKNDVFYDKYMKSIGDEIGSTFEPIYQNIRDIHLHSDLEYDYPVGNLRYVQIFAIVGILLIVIACINYTILATSIALERRREVGMRKVVGATRGILTWQFLTESTIIALVSVILGLVLASLTLPFFNQLTNMQLDLTPLYSPTAILLFIGLVIILGLGSGLYPALYLSSFSPNAVLREEKGPKTGIVRNALVIMQFTIAVFLIISTLIVRNQLNFMQNRDLGMRTENAILFALSDSASAANKDFFKDKMEENPDILDITMVSNVPVGPGGRLVHYIETDEGLIEKPINYIFVEDNYIDFMDMQIVAGDGWDTTQIQGVNPKSIVNRALVEEMGWTLQEAIGKTLDRGQADSPGHIHTEIGAVVENFNYTSLHNPVEPITIFAYPILHVYMIRHAEGRGPAVEDFLKGMWEKTNSIFPIKTYVLDNVIADMYESERRTAAAFGVLSGISLFISLLGLLGLASHTINRRRREIAIRKVLGATPSGIAGMFGRVFTKRVLVANVISWPIVWYAMGRWLENFAFRTQRGLASFIIALLISFIVAWATVYLQSLGRANRPPLPDLE